MGVSANDYEIADSLEPSKDGVKVYLVGYPEVLPADDKVGKSVRFTYKSTEKEDAQESFRLFDFINQKEDLKENLRAANTRRGFSLLTAMMPEAQREEFGKIQHTDLETAIATAIKFFDPEFLNLPLTIMFGYSKTGFKELRLFANCISSPHKPKSLVWDPNMSVKPTARAKKDADEQADDEDDV